MEKINSKTPTHLGFIVDGNRRWARERGLPTLEGHRRGADKVEILVEELAKHHIPYTSLYLFSTENWNRSPEEVSYLMDLLGHAIVRLTKKFKKLNLRCVQLGGKDRIPPDLLKKIAKAEAETADCTAGTVGICFNYGGQQEIADAATAILRERLADNTIPTASTPAPAPSASTTDSLAPITPDELSAHLYHPEIPPCDMIIRTSGEERISGFMLWRAAYSEFLFLDKYFPDIEPSDVDLILAEYSHRQRRFGR